VDFTLKKFVRKPRGSAPGAADYEKETTIEVTPDT
jgi:predicted ribosome quality control (RQC) complex YloA/Tae2 family protein